MQHARCTRFKRKIGVTQLHSWDAHGLPRDSRPVLCPLLTRRQSSGGYLLTWPGIGGTQTQRLKYHTNYLKYFIVP